MQGLRTILLKNFLDLDVNVARGERQVFKQQYINNIGKERNEAKKAL